MQEEPATGPSEPSPPDPEVGERAPARRLRRIGVVAVVLALITAGVVAAARDLSATLYCVPPPTGQQKAALEDFVRAHLGDARNFKWTISDCDDAGLWELDFVTNVTPGAADSAFRADPSCSHNHPNAKDEVTWFNCKSDAIEVELTFEGRKDGRTNGYLERR